MKQVWQRMSLKIDELGLRERIFIFLMAVVVLIALVNTVTLGQRFAKESELSRKIAQDQSQIAGIQAEIRGKVAAFNPNPDAANLTHLHQIDQKSKEMRETLRNMQKGLVSPDRMTALLEDILKQNGKLRLVSLRTLPATGLNEPDVQDKGKQDKGATDTAAQKQIDDALKVGHSLADAKDKLAKGTGSPLVYKHGVEIVIEGDYLEMVNYMTAVEAMPWQLFWGKAVLSANESSKLSLKLTLYTLSLDKKWLSI